MLYRAKKDTSLTEFQGESFTKALGKRTKDTWLSNEGAHGVLTNDSTGEVIYEADLDLSADEISLVFFMGKTTTADLEGNHTLIIFQTDSNVVEFYEKMKEYKITYKTRIVSS